MPKSVDHRTVLLQEAVLSLVTDRDGFYIDGTFGRGGHSAAILDVLSAEGRLLAVDKDPDACAVGVRRFAEDRRFEMVHGSFAELAVRLEQRGQQGTVAGVLLDLGVSSPQLDDPNRGFSFSKDGPLDMRMNSAAGISAAQWLATAAEQDIARVLKEYGEEKYARRMARAIVAARGHSAITTTSALAHIISTANPAWEKGKHPATRAFQGIRIFINRELEDLQIFLPQVLDLLRVGGRLVVISFHSLEDRIVKHFIRDHERPVVPRGIPVFERDIPRRMRSVGKAVRPAPAEVDDNPRARSAVMRVAEKLM